MIRKERYSNNVAWTEDTSFFFVVCNVVNSYKFIKKYGLLDIIFVFQKKNKNSAVYIILELKKYEHFYLSNDSITTYMKSVVKKIMNCKGAEQNKKNLV